MGTVCLCAMSLLAGCAAPVAVKLDSQTPAQWQQPMVAAGQTDLAQWWRAWNDPALNALVEEALAQNLDVAQAVLRLRQQRLLADSASAPFRPTVSAGARTLQDIAAVDSYFHASIDVVWDLGLFGDSQAARRAAGAGVLDAQAQLHAARVALVADVVHRYLDIRLAQVQRALAAQQQQQATRQLQLLQIRRAQRLADTDVLQQQQLQWSAAQTQLAALNEAQARSAHALAALLGRDRPESQWLQADAAATLPSVQPISVVPADLLRRRPDIQSAEAAVEQAAAEAGVSQAALYPRLTLTGSLLFAYNLTRNHRTTADTIPMVGPQIDIPLFDWGRRRAVADGKDLALQASIKAYRQAVLNGIAEAEGVLAAVAAQQQRLQNLQAAQQIHAERDKAQAVRQKLGLSSELDAVDGSRARLQNQSDMATAKAAQALAYVALYKAVGAAPLDVADQAQAPTRTAEVQP